MKLSLFTFAKKPENYQKIDELVSRSARPKKSNIKWLKKHGVTDIVDFTSAQDSAAFNERAAVEKVGIHYHNIPTNPFHPRESQVGEFLDLVEGVKQQGGKVHIHCKHGADRTGMYSWIYKQKHGLGEMEENRKEMIKMGHDFINFPRLIGWITDYLYKGWR